MYGTEYTITLEPTIRDIDGNQLVDKFVLKFTTEPNPQKTDSDNDGWNDTIEIVVGTDPLDNLSFPLGMDIDTIPDLLDNDMDGDGWNNTYEDLYGSDKWNASIVPPDEDNDSIPDQIDDDRDGDGVPNDDDKYPDDPTRWEDEVSPSSHEPPIWVWGGFGVIILLFVLLAAVVMKEEKRRANK